MLTVHRNQVDTREYSQSTDNAFGAPETVQEVFPAGETNPSHAGVLNDFVAAVTGEAKLPIDASEGLNSVELANAMVYSAWINAPVELPLDCEAYESALSEKIAASPPRKRKVREVISDMEKSWS